MQKGYSMADEKVIIDFTALYCDTSVKLLSSELFRELIYRYLTQLINRDSRALEQIARALSSLNPEKLTQDVIVFLRLLHTCELEEIGQINEKFIDLITQRDVLYDFIEGLYNYWRQYERYILLTAPETRLRTRVSIHHAQFIKANETLKRLVLKTYRELCEKLIDNPFRVYRQLPAGAQVGLFTQHVSWNCPEEYKALKKIPFIRLALLEPPVIFYPRRNTRKGLFQEIDRSPLVDIKFSADEWFCYPARIGKLLAFAYFHKSFMSHGNALANLFELANYEDIFNKTPDVMVIFGAPQTPVSDEITMFYNDARNHLLVGYEVGCEDIDYFGYMKKMLLTLHNVHMIEQGLLPVHGAMVSVRLKSKISSNIVIVGDSGAGKSETLEAFRQLAKDYINEMTIIFDDMGSLEITPEGEILGYGTETGAFLRLDDLQPGYAYEQIDRSIFMNPHQTNARLIFPVTSYDKIIAGTSVDFFMYANNYEPVGKEYPEIELFKNVKDALDVFNQGRRKAKGTTAETGLVDSYFANPFGAPQRKKAHSILAEKFMKQMFSRKINVGQIRTQLAIEGMEQNGPQLAAKALFELMNRD